jgi:hypothetical protein
MTMNAIHTLLRHSIDYAGLFPPAALTMSAAVRNYALYRRGDDEWALGRFILPADRLMEFEEQAAALPGGLQQSWQISALAGLDLEGDLAYIDEFHRLRAVPGMEVDTLEVKVDRVGSIPDAMRKIPDGLPLYFEIPLDRDPTELLRSLAAAGGRAKVRTGGVTVEAFPSTANLARFIHACIAANVPFKATAGLHHALRGDHRLTYEDRSATGTMFGFLNLFLGTASARAGHDEKQTRSILEESSPEAFQFEAGAIRWRDQQLGLDDLARARQSIVSFGSCSFTEPITELQALQSSQQNARQA